jgi:metastasis-associated protein MTA
MSLNIKRYFSKPPFFFVLKDQFYYHLTYDPYQKSLVADKGEIRVGTKYQAEVPHLKVQTGPNGTVVVADNDDVATSHSQSSAGNDRVLRSQLQRNQSQIVEIPISQQTEEILQWCPLGCTLSSFRNQLSDADIDKFLMIAKSIGTFARALDCNNAYKQPSLPLSAAAASREVTLVNRPRFITKLTELKVFSNKYQFITCSFTP